MADAFGAGMALGFQALSAKRQRQQEERQQQQFDLLMGEREKDIAAQDAVKVFMGEAATLNDPEALRSTLYKHLPKFMDSPTATNQALAFIKGHPAIVQTEGVDKLDREMAKEKWKIDYQDMKQRGRMELGASLRPQSVAGTGGSKGKAEKIPASVGEEFENIKTKEVEQTDEQGNITKVLVDEQFGLPMHVIDPYTQKQIPNPNNPAIQRNFGRLAKLGRRGGYNDVWQALQFKFPDMDEQDLHKLSYKLWSKPDEAAELIADVNLLRPFKAPSGTKPLGIPSPQGGPQPYPGMAPMEKLDAVAPTSTSKRGAALPEQPNTLRGMAELMMALGGGQEPEPLAPPEGRWDPASEIYREKIWQQPGSEDATSIYRAPVTPQEIFRSEIPSSEIYRAPVSPLAEYRSRMPRSRLDYLRAAVPKSNLKPTRKTKGS